MHAQEDAAVTPIKKRKKAPVTPTPVSLAPINLCSDSDDDDDDEVAEVAPATPPPEDAPAVIEHDSPPVQNEVPHFPLPNPTDVTIHRAHVGPFDLAAENKHVAAGRNDMTAEVDESAASSADTDSIASSSNQGKNGKSTRVSHEPNRHATQDDETVSTDSSAKSVSESSASDRESQPRKVATKVVSSKSPTYRVSSHETCR